ncbi:hypothetical protein [Roseisolibacter sp. H3M3-2]|uniref:hypothetical protein n=1 Tax=Roseisolibacter sp. H3M3-2 TaxID=3031323 RepID=UPI0023DBB1D9|nr:hypothetical protein [Roseisolibacter sp. H3M3-2]MDF1503713.1 hypothetical protein [Roseisolibacter sp. H3M3-2]
MEREPRARTRGMEELPGRAPLVAPDPGTPAGRRRSVRTLLLAWTVYWLALLLWQLRPAIAQWWAIRNQEHGTITVSFGGDLSTGLAWITIPPLLMMVVWLLARRRSG